MMGQRVSDGWVQASSGQRRLARSSLLARLLAASQFRPWNSGSLRHSLFRSSRIDARRSNCSIEPMISPSASHVLALADSSGWETCVEKTRGERGENGQFFTPPAIASCLAGWFQPEGFNRPSLHLLDPGAGGGVLTAALVDRIATLHASGALPDLEEITLEVWELDEAFLPALRWSCPPAHHPKTSNYSS
jgi:hypothetical protein